MAVSKGQYTCMGLFADPYGTLSRRSDPVWFDEKLARIISSVQGSVWTTPVDMMSADGTNPARPRANTLTLRRVEFIIKLRHAGDEGHDSPVYFRGSAARWIFFLPAAVRGGNCD